MISTLLKQSKKNYCDNYFKDNINNMKSTLEEIKSIISPQKQTNNSPKTITLGDLTVNNPLIAVTVNPLKANDSHHIETRQLICNANQLTGSYMMGNFGG